MRTLKAESFNIKNIRKDQLPCMFFRVTKKNKLVKQVKHLYSIKPKNIQNMFDCIVSAVWSCLLSESKLATCLTVRAAF